MLLWGAACSVAIFTHAQEPAFPPPLQLPLLLSGNFAELRADHFHGGLDFKTGGTEGHPVRALADGYVSRLSVSRGSGYAIHVVYDNGYTAICRHLSAFAPDMARLIEELQYHQQEWEADITLQPGHLTVHAGQLLGLSGNTGYSFGPHLHLDLLETETGDYVDPLPFFARSVADHTPPRAEGLMLFPQAGRGVVDGRSAPVSLPLRGRTPSAWGWIGAGIRAYDYMEGTQNRYGVHTVILEVDGREVFRSVADRFSSRENRYINSWTRGQYMKSFVDPGNRLRMLHADPQSRGLVLIDEERPYRFLYTLKDALGNTTRIPFTVQGRRMPVAGRDTTDADRDGRLFRWDRTNHLQGPGMDLVVPRGRLYDDVVTNLDIRADSAGVAWTYRLTDTPVPLHDYALLRIALRRRPTDDASKYYVASVDARGHRRYAGGTLEDGAMRVKIRELGAYTVAVDTTPPVITPLNPRQWGRQGRITVRASDSQTGVGRYRGTIDGRYALFGIPNAVRGELVCVLDPRRVEKGVEHTLSLTVTDRCGNQSTLSCDFIY